MSIHTYLVCVISHSCPFGEDAVYSRQTTSFSVKARGDGTAFKLAQDLVPAGTRTLEMYRVVNGVVSRYSTREIALQNRATYGRGR